jgi:hypothetical protein
VGTHTQINGYETETMKVEHGDRAPTSAEERLAPRAAIVITPEVPGTWTN